MQEVQQPGEAARKGEVWDQQMNICNTIDSIRKLLGQLEGRLSPVLQSQAASGAAETAVTPKPPPLPMLVKQLTANRDDLQSIETRISILLERLEL